MKKYTILYSLLGLLILSSNPVFAVSNTTDSKITFSQRPLNENDLIEKFDLISGNISIDFDVEQEKLTASTDFLIKNSTNKEITKILFVLNPGLNIENINIGDLKIKEIIKEKTNPNEPLGYVIYLENPILPNKSVNLKINYSGEILGNYKFGRIKENDIFLTSKSYFYPRFEKLQNFSSHINLNVKVPNDYLIVSQAESFTGKKEKEQTIFTGTVNNINGLNNENGFNLASAKYKVYRSNNLDIYYRDPADKSLLEYMIKFETSALLSLEKIFGKHDYQKFNIVEVNRDDLGGMASVNTIFLSDKNFGNYLNKSRPQYDYFKKLYSSEIRIDEEYKYYLRTVLAHESAHLYFNYFYTYDKPWFAEGFPEFISLKILEDSGQRPDLERKLKEYYTNLIKINNTNLPSLNTAFLDSEKGYSVNYWATPFVLYGIWEIQGNDFWKNLDNLLKNDQKNITYNNFKKYFKFDNEMADIFEKEFKLADD